jgi:spermidine/putrescine transport system permease protein
MTATAGPFAGIRRRAPGLRPARAGKAVDPIDYSKRGWLRALVAVIFVLLYAPLVVLVVFSFNDSRRNIVWQGFTTEYYVKAVQDDTLVQAFINSLTIASVSTIVSTLLGTLAALVLWRFRFPGRPAYEGLTSLPIVIPEICMGVAMMTFYAQIGWPTDLPWPLILGKITIAHIAFTFPFVMIIVRARLAGFNRELEEASNDLGANEWQTLRYIVLPYLKPGIIAGALIGFVLSLDDFVITFFTAGPNSVTLPIKIFSMIRFGVSPTINAASTILIVVSVTATLLAVWVYRPGRIKADDVGG